jgi:hypothetical protein
MKFNVMIISQFLTLRTSDIMIYYYSMLEIFRINTSSTCRKNSEVSSSLLEGQQLLMWVMIFSFLLMSIDHHRAKNGSPLNLETVQSIHILTLWFKTQLHFTAPIYVYD